jgi:hypothetical protein
MGQGQHDLSRLWTEALGTLLRKLPKTLTAVDQDRPSAAQAQQHTGCREYSNCNLVRSYHLSIASNSPINPAITDKPPCQNAGSRASSPKGLSSSAWCLVPPAASISR